MALDKISAITLSIRNMHRSCKFYSRIKVLRQCRKKQKTKLDPPTTKQQRRQLKSRNAVTSPFNLHLLNKQEDILEKNMTCSRTIFRTDDVDKLYDQLKI